MTALTANSPLVKAQGNGSVPLAASTTLYEGVMVGDNGSGYGRGLVAGDRFLGHNIDKVDNSDGSAGDLNADLMNGIYRLQVTLSGVAITDAKRPVYASDDATLTLVPTSNSYVGKVVRYVAASTAIVEFNTLADGVEDAGLLFANTARATSVENTTSETDFDQSYTLDGTRLKKGDVINIKGMVWVEDTNSTDTLTLKLYFGTEVIWTSATVDVADNDLGIVDVDVIVNVIGASGKIAFTGIGVLGVPGTIVPTAFTNSTAAGETEDISGDVAIKMSATWSVAHADNECELVSLIVTKKNAPAA